LGGKAKLRAGSIDVLRFFDRGVGREALTLSSSRQWRREVAAATGVPKFGSNVNDAGFKLKNLSPD